MLEQTAPGVEFAGGWRTFLQRKVLTTTWEMGFVPSTHFPVRFPPLREIVISLLFVDLVSLLDAAFETQMTPERFVALLNLSRRIDALAAEGKVLDKDALHRLRDRRNDIAHELIRIERPELDAAVAVVQRQLEAWHLVGPAPAYEAFAERSSAQESTRPDGSFMFRWTVGVRLDGRFVLSWSWEEHVLREGAE